MTPDLQREIPYETMIEKPLGINTFRVEAIGGTYPGDVPGLQMPKTWLDAVFILVPGADSPNVSEEPSRIGGISLTTTQELQEIPDEWIRDVLAAAEEVYDDLLLNPERKPSFCNPILNGELQIRVGHTRMSNRWKILKITSPQTTSSATASDAPSPS